MTYHRTFPAWSRGPEAAGDEQSEIEESTELSAAVNRLESAVEGGLAFYWILVTAASKAADRADAVLTFGDPVTERSPPAGGGEPAFPPGAPVSLDVEVSSPAGGDGVGGDRELEAFTRRVAGLVMREQIHRALRFGRDEALGLEAQAAHDIRALLQPLMLHVDQLRRNGSPSDESLELLDDLTRGLVQWVEEDLEGGGLRWEDRFPSPTGSPGTHVGGALEEALEGKARDNLTKRIDDDLPEVSVDRGLLEPGLLELVELGRQTPRRLRVDSDGKGHIRIGVQFDYLPEGVSPPDVPGTRNHAPVVGGLLNLVAWTNGSVRLETGPGTAGKIVVRLPTAAPSSSGRIP